MSVFQQVVTGAPGNLEDAELVIGDKVSTLGYKAAGVGADDYVIAATGAVGVTIKKGDVAVSQDTTYDIRKYGGVEGENVTTVLQYLIDNFNQAYIPFGMTVFGLNIKCDNKTIMIVDGTIKMPDNSPRFASIFVNKDTSNGNKGINISGKGTIDGNSAKQTDGPQYLAFFYKCDDCNITVKTLKNNFMPHDYSGPTTPNHPLSPFEFGVPFGEASFVDPIFSAVIFIDGNNNHVSNFELLNWGQEGIVHWFSTGSTITNFTAINGIESDNPYYVAVDFGSLDLSADVVIGSKVNVDDSHAAGGQPYLIYSSVIDATGLNLSLEDYSDALKWTLVERDITADNGFTAARASGGGSTNNKISGGYAAFCRASSFSSDSLTTTMHDLNSYHNSFQPGINFGHTGSPASGSIGSSLTAINAGWKGGLSGSNYGINVVASSKNVSIDGFYVVGAGRAGVNVSDSADDAKFANGNIRFSAAQGLNVFQSTANAVNVTSVNNIGVAFNAQTGGILNLANCEDDKGMIPTQQLDANTVSRTFLNTSRDGKLFTAFRAIFSVAAATAIATIVFDTITSSDNMVVTTTYSERNLGTPTATSQFVVEETILVSGSGGVRTINVLDTKYAQLRTFRYAWTGSNTLEIYLQDLSVDVLADAQQNSLFVVAQSNANANMFLDIGIPL